MTRKDDIKFDYHVGNDYCYVKSSDHCVKNADNILQLVTFKNDSMAMDYLGMSKKYDCEVTKIYDVPVVVTGATSNHFEESLELLDNIRNVLIKKIFPNIDIKLVYYDLGLQKSEYEAVTRNCSCEVRAFPFHIFPEHFRNISNFAWKPAIIRRMLYEEDFIMWVDSSIRFTEDRNIGSVFKKSRLNGIQCMQGEGTIAERTALETMLYLKQDPDYLLQYTEVQGGFGIYSRSRFIIEAVINPWVLCALDKNCIWPGKASHLPHDCVKLKSHQQFSFCHRADQSVLGIILTHTFKRNRDKCATFLLDDTARMHRVNHTGETMEMEMLTVGNV